MTKKKLADHLENSLRESLNYYAVKARLNPKNKNMEVHSVVYNAAEDGIRNRHDEKFGRKLDWNDIDGINRTMEDMV